MNIFWHLWAIEFQGTFILQISALGQLTTPFNMHVFHNSAHKLDNSCEFVISFWGLSINFSVWSFAKFWINFKILSNCHVLFHHYSKRQHQQNC